MDWTSPRSSVTWWLSSGSGQLAAVDRGAFGGRDVDAEPREACGRGMGARGGRRSRTPADAVEGGSQLAGEGHGELSERVADHPSAMAVPGRAGLRGLRPQERARRVEVEARQGPKGPRDRLLHVGLRI